MGDITSTPARGSGFRRSASPTPPITPLSPLHPKEAEDDIDRLVALHNRSGLQVNIKIFIQFNFLVYSM